MIFRNPRRQVCGASAPDVSDSGAKCGRTAPQCLARRTWVDADARWLGRPGMQGPGATHGAHGVTQDLHLGAEGILGGERAISLILFEGERRYFPGSTAEKPSFTRWFGRPRWGPLRSRSVARYASKTGLGWVTAPA